MKYLSPIDPHVHLRWNEYPHHPFMTWALCDAFEVGLCAVMEMPNTDPPLTTRHALAQRFTVVREAYAEIAAHEPYPDDRVPAYYAHQGLTGRVTEVAQAFDAGAREGVKGFKMFCCHSTGNMGLLYKRQRQNVWHVAAESGYTGAIIVHAEDHTEFGEQPSRPEQYKYKNLFDPEKPESHSVYQNEEAESAAVFEQLWSARQANFKGTIVFAHISSNAAVSLVNETMSAWQPDFRVMFEVTWHHLFLNVEDDYPIHGNRVKMNPPLRRKATQEALLNTVLARPKWFFIGSDHAPHPVEAKDRRDPLPASGIPAIPFWPKGIELLCREGLDAVGLRRITHDNAVRTFQLDVPQGLRSWMVDTEYDPRRWERYGWNPFSRWG